MGKLLRLATPLTVILFLSHQGFTQTTYEQVYTVFQSNCTNSGCHNNTDQAAGLNLEGCSSSNNAIELLRFQAEKVSTIISQHHAPGNHTLRLKETDLTKSMDFISLQHNGEKVVQKYLGI